jgi:hypothetical protein
MVVPPVAAAARRAAQRNRASSTDGQQLDGRRQLCPSRRCRASSLLRRDTPSLTRHSGRARATREQRAWRHVAAYRTTQTRWLRGCARRRSSAPAPRAQQTPTRPPSPCRRTRRSSPARYRRSRPVPRRRRTPRWRRRQRTLRPHASATCHLPYPAPPHPSPRACELVVRLFSFLTIVGATRAQTIANARRLGGRHGRTGTRSQVAVQRQLLFFAAWAVGAR